MLIGISKLCDTKLEILAANHLSIESVPCLRERLNGDFLGVLCGNYVAIKRSAFYRVPWGVGQRHV